MKRRFGMLAFFAGLCLASASADESKTLYVAKDGNDLYDGYAAVYDGTHGPKFRIQSAIDAANAGDTVMVAPGIYGDEQGAVSADTAGLTVRVFINKSITLKSSGGRDETFIVGKRSNATEQGWGEGAVSGIRVASTVATSSNNPVEIEGFTFRDCCTDIAGKNGGVIGWNGGILPAVSEDGSSTGPWVVSCAISNCSYRAYGAIGRVNAARVRVQNVHSDHTGVGAYQCNLVFCAFTGLNGQPGLLGSAKQYAINCTFSNGSHNLCSSSCFMNFCNSAFVANVSAGIWCTNAVNCVFPARPQGGIHADQGNFYNGNAEAQIASPLFGDFRPVLQADPICSQSVLCGNGDARWLEIVPPKYRSLDLDGNSFSAGESGRIHIGALQTPMTPVAGFYIANTNDVKHTSITVDGMCAASSADDSYCATKTFLDAKQWPRCFEISVQLSEGKHFLGYQGFNSTRDRFFFPTKDNRILFVPELGEFTRICGRVGAKVFYVDANNGNDDKYDGSKPAADGNAGPFETIQKAVDSVADHYGVIYVAPGLYNKGATEYPAATPPRCRIAMKSQKARIRILASGLAEETIVAGEPDTTSDPSLVDGLGNGPNAVRIIRCNGSASGCIQGFTLTDGHTDSSAHTSTTSWRGGGALMTDGNTNFLLMDCIVTNNHAAVSGAAMYGGQAVRCVFADNKSAESGYRTFFSSTILSGCLFWAAAGDTQPMLSGKDTYSNVRVIHCSSFAEEKVSIFPAGLHSYWFNNVIMNNSNVGGNDSSLCASGNVLEGTLYSDKGINAKGSAYVNGSVFYVDAPGKDMRILSGSAAIGAGTAWTDLANGTRLDAGTAWTNYYSHLQHDFNGDRLFFHDGNPTAGAYQKPSKHLVLAPVNRPNGVSVSVPMTNVLDFGESITVTAEDGKRKVLGLEVDGEFLETNSFTVRAPDSAAAKMSTVKIVANTNWYVDAENGLDSNKGWSEDVPMFTLAEAMKNVEPGDVVVALPGTYKEGSMIQDSAVIKDSPAPALRSRVVVPEGVSLVSRDGAEATVIKGEHMEGSKYGADAMRCVYLGKGARLSGFTVAGGATHSDVATLNDNTSGAGIFCAEDPMGTITSPLPQTLVTDCIISNNVAKYGGGGAYRGCKVIRCRFFGNGSENEGGALADCCVYESIFDGNYGARGVSNPREVRGCTFGSGTKNWKKNGAQLALYSDPVAATWPVYNCLFLGGAKCAVKYAYNCIVPEEGFINSAREGFVHDNIMVAEVDTDPSYTPAYDSAAANAANAEYVKGWELDGDAYGNPRRSNGGVDVGAVETDWRVRYAAVLGGGISISEVSWETVATSTPGVMLHDGNSMAVEWPFGQSLQRVRGEVKFLVDEGATLLIARSGCEPVSFGPGFGEFRMDDVAGIESLELIAKGGNVELVGFNQKVPFAIIVR